MGNGGKVAQFGAESAGRATGEFVAEMRELVGSERYGINVGAARVGIFAVAGMRIVGEIHERGPEAGGTAQSAGDG